MNEHTPEPWGYTEDADDGGGARFVIHSLPWTGEMIAATSSHGPHYKPHGPEVQEDEANARFIVRACNAHEDLLAACEAVEAQLLKDAEGCCPEKLERLRPLYDQVLAAIAKAKETPDA